MRSIANLFSAIVILAAVAMFGCKSSTEKATISYRIVSDSLYRSDSNYLQDFRQWKKIYEDCTHDSLFSNAFYLGLQSNIHIGSICNRSAINVNGTFHLLDISNLEQNLRLLNINHSNNCYSNAPAAPALRREFNNELMNALNNSADYKFLKDYIDSNHQRINIASLSDNTIVPDSVVSLLQHTTDSSLTRFHKILTTEGNAMMVRAVMVNGFYSQFTLAKKLLPTERSKFANEVTFNVDNSGSTASIKFISENRMQVTVNKYYTVFCQFYDFADNPIR